MARWLKTPRRKAGSVVVTFGVIALALVACTGAIGAEIYIHQTLASGDVGSNEYATASAGTSEILPRDYPGAPPHVPHSLDGLTVSKEDNNCLACHAIGLRIQEGHTATKIPESHYTNQVSGLVTEELQALRYGCLLCHLPQSPEAFPLDE